MPPTNEQLPPQNVPPKSNKKILISMTVAVILIGISAGGVFGFLKYQQYQKDLADFQQLKDTQEKNSRTVLINIKPDTPEDKIFALKASIEKQPGVISVDYTSATDTLALFKTRHQDDTVSIEALDALGTNPFNATLSVVLSDAAQRNSMDSFVKSNDQDSIVDNTY